MKRWLLMVLLTGFLGATGLDASADQGRRAHHRQHRPEHQLQHQPQHYHHQQQHHKHQHPHKHHDAVRSFTGIVVVPVIVPRYIYAPVPYSYYPPAPAAGHGYAPGPADYLYFCPDSKRYYPDVLECPSGWLAVVPGVGGPPRAPY